jgi:anaerobic ribonucleoside-triphosphate reductase
MKLRPVTFKWNDLGLQQYTKDIEQNTKSVSGKPEDDKVLWDQMRSDISQKNSGLQLGFIAQEFEKVFPDFVNTDKEGYKQINTEKLNIFIVQAMKEQQAEIEQLKAAKAKQATELEALKIDKAKQATELEALKADVEAIKALLKKK